MFAAHIGCSPGLKVKYPEEIMMPTLPKDVQNYALFLKQNMKEINEKYSKEYALFNFVVDTDYGSTLIQTFIDTEAVSSITDNLGVKKLEYKEKISNIYDYVIHEYAFIMDPFRWQTVEETVKTKKGDCKSLSLLLMSLLLSAGIDSYVAISNGHMWTNVYFDNQWHVLEVDKDSDRNKIYQIPGFYKDPLYKVFIDHTVKRKRFQSQSSG
ncbi:MAG: hypothetical protein KJ687_05285 [Proteobacteria bacterium]|nr:hypothetical protein [Pseudomonadota bacterium]